MRKYDGSLTVEASILMSIIVFIVIAQLYVLYFFHDKVMMQSYAYRIAENKLWEREEEEVSLLMMTLSGMSTQMPQPLTDLFDIVGSRKRVQVNVDGSMKIGIAGSIPFLGEQLNAQFLSDALLVDYTQDRLRCIFLKRIKNRN